MTFYNPLHEKFARFAGREVNATEQTSTRHFKHLGITHTSTTVTIDENDPAVAELRAAVKAAGYSLRLWLPDTAGTADYRVDRFNANIEKGEDGKYRIQPPFKLG